jgi:sugar phosphate isomerase/epimerase
MVRDLSKNPRACSINTATLGFQSPIADVIESVARAGFGGIAPWRREVEGHDVKAIGKRIHDAGIATTGYCRSTYIPSATRAGFEQNVEANRKAIADAALLGSTCFVMVVGGLPAGSKDLSAARTQVAEASGLLTTFGKSVGVRIALEPLHPVYAADRSCLTLMSEALDMCDAVEGATDDPWLGVLPDCYHIWWDPNVARDIARAGAAKRIFGFHVCDWLVPTEDVLNDRGMMGDGVIDVRGIRAMVEATGYLGPVECEIFSAKNWWVRPMAETLRVCAERFASAT